jgi:hypothetical protein
MNSVSTHIDLKGLEIAPSQVFGSVRLVPLLRPESGSDLRLAQRRYREDAAMVALSGDSLLEPDLAYFSYVPHGLVLSWTDDGSAAEAAFGGQISKSDGLRVGKSRFHTTRVLHRMVKREEKNRLRFLPLHLAMEGFLEMFFSGPPIAWEEYTRQALRDGLSPRGESSVPGVLLSGLEDALRIFEIHERQVGVLLFVAEALASAFVASDPMDYQSLHLTLLQDFYGELIYQYGLLYDTTIPLSVTIDDKNINDLAGLRAASETARARWGEFHGFQASDLIGRQALVQRIYTGGPFTLERFITDLDPSGENHIGERIRRTATGELMYLKTFRLTATQTRRVYLLSKLAENEWNLDSAAAMLGTDRNGLVLRLTKAGFGYLLKPDILSAAQKADWLTRTGGKDA